MTESTGRTSPDYIEIVKRAATDTWKHKALWLFGFFLAAGGGGGGSGNYSMGGTGGGNVPSDGISRQLDSLSGVNWSSIIVLAIVVGLFLLLVGVVLFVLKLISQGALIGMAREIGRGRAPGVGDGFRMGGRYWLRIFGVDFLVALPILLIVLLIVVMAFVALAATGVFASGGSASGAAAGAGAICSVLGIIAFGVILIIPFAIVLGVLGELARRQAVLLDRGVFESLSEGWAMIKERFKDVALMWLTMVVVNLIVGMVMAMVALVLIVPGAFLLFLSPIAGVALLIPGALVLVFAMGVIQAFVSVAWSDFFMVIEPAAA